jgi:hypothetical protein
MAAGFLLAVWPLVLTSNTISLLPRWQKLFFDHAGRIASDLPADRIP